MGSVPLRRPLPAIALLALLVAPAARAAEPIMPLASVQPGLKCTALSVISGTTASEFDVDVLDVIRGEAGSAGPRILVRVSGPAIDGTGIGPGFSGSPVYCPGPDGARQNAGAISESIGAFGNKVALATPIEEILGESPDAPAGARSGPALRAAARPIATPLTVSGLSTEMRGRLGRAARRARALVLAAPAGPLSSLPPIDLQPGSAIAAGTASGDISVGAIGTLSYRDGDAVWAFGHPLNNAGRRALPLQDAYVYGVIDNPIGSEESITYKLASAGRPVGTLTNDTSDAIVGRLGPLPRTISLAVGARDLDTGRTTTVRSQVADERDLELGSGLDLVSGAALGQALDSVLHSAPPRVSGRMCASVKLRGRAKPLGFCNDYFDGAKPFDDLSTAMGLVDSFKLGQITPESVNVQISLRRGVREEFMIAAKAPRRAKAGSRIPIRLLLQRRRGGRRHVTFTYRVPRSTRPGRRTLTLRGIVPQSLASGSEEGLELILEGVAEDTQDSPGPPSVGALAAAIAAIGHRDGVRATFAEKGRGPIVLRPNGLLRGKLEIPLRVTRASRRR